MDWIFDLSYIQFLFLFFFFMTEFCIFIYIFLEKKLFCITRGMKQLINKSRWIGKIIFLILGYFFIFLEIIPNVLAVLAAGTVSFFQYISNKNISYKKCFMRKIAG